MLRPSAADDDVSRAQPGSAASPSRIRVITVVIILSLLSFPAQPSPYCLFLTRSSRFSIWGPLFRPRLPLSPRRVSTAEPRTWPLTDSSSTRRTPLFAEAERGCPIALSLLRRSARGARQAVVLCSRRLRILFPKPALMGEQLRRCRRERVAGAVAASLAACCCFWLHAAAAAARHCLPGALGALLLATWGWAAKLASNVRAPRQTRAAKHGCMVSFDGRQSS